MRFRAGSLTDFLNEPHCTRTRVSIQIASVRTLESTQGLALTSVFVQLLASRAFKSAGIETPLAIANITIEGVSVRANKWNTELFALTGCFDQTSALGTLQITSTHA